VTVPRRGYRFTASVLRLTTNAAVPTAEPSPATPKAGARLQLSPHDRPCVVAVLPFASVSAAREIVERAQSRMEMLDKLGKMGNRPAAEIARDKRHVGTAARTVAKDVREGSINHRNIRSAIDYRAVNKSSTAKGKPSPLFAAFAKEVADGIHKRARRQAEIHLSPCPQFRNHFWGHVTGSPAVTDRDRNVPSKAPVCCASLLATCGQRVQHAIRHAAPRLARQPPGSVDSRPGGCRGLPRFLGEHGGNCHRAIGAVKRRLTAQPPSAPRRGIGRGHAGGQPPGSGPPGDLPAAADTSPFLGATGATYLGTVKGRLTLGPGLGLGYLRCAGAYAIPQ
jgi:hypothetical protein